MARRRVLHPDELEIWRSVARSAKPLHKTPILQPQTDVPAPIAEFQPAPLAPTAVPRFQIGQAIKTVPQGIIAAKPPALRMDAKTHAKMKRGKLSPEARIDLHGMTVAQAHPALIGFVLNAYTSGLRLVLVITGKGKAKGEYAAHNMGVLRQQVPHWLHMAPLAPHILQVTEAHATHGGGGALYVYLRRR